MFANFIYFIISLMITVTYQLSEKPETLSWDVAFLFFGLLILFMGFVYQRFKSLETRLDLESHTRLDYRFNTTMTNSSILAVLLLSLYIYGLKLPYYIDSLPLFRHSPTVLALVFMLLFIGHLAVIWTMAHGAYQKIYKSDITRSAYVLSYLKFSVPVLLPWLTLSGVLDIINALPFEGLKRFLSTPQGQFLYVLFFVFVVAIIAPVIIQRIWGCQSLEPGDLRTRIDELCKKAGVQYADILYWPIFGGRMITAGVMGLIRRFRYILVTEALLRLLDPTEIDAVISHEIGHVKKKHLVFYIFFFIGMLPVIGFVEVASRLLFSYAMVFEPVYRFFNEFPAIGVFTENLFLIILAFLIYFRFVFGFFMRNFERQADCYVFQLFDTATPLITTLKKITITSRTASDRPNWHHFSIKERIDYLLKAEQDKSWITRQDRKIRKGIAVYIVGILMVSWGALHFNDPEVQNRISESIILNLPDEKFEKIQQSYIKALKADPTNPLVLGWLGTYFQKDCQAAIQAHENALEVKPQDPMILNNLAWFYATCDESAFRNPARALALAQMAAGLSDQAFILDTLAESYFANGMYREALETGRQALKNPGSHRAHIEKQVEKFRNALEGGE